MANPNQMNAAQWALLQWEVEEEKARQRAIQQSRNYYAGKQTTYLSMRLREILDLDGAPNVDQMFHLNVCDKVIHAVAERLHVDSFTSEDETFAEWAWSVWQANRTDGFEWDIYEGLRRDGEYFLLVDLDENNQPRFTPHPRYVDPTLGGDGYGCRAYYPNEDPTQEMLRAVKRWTDYGDDGKAQQRMTVYYPDHMEKFEMESGHWSAAVDEDDEPGEAGIVPWVDAQGKPLGIPVIHFRNRGLICEIDSSVVSMQNLLNKTLIDLAESADQSAFRVWLAFGFIPTSDGKALASDGSNRAKIQPNRIIGTTKPPSEVSMQAVAGESPIPLIDVIERIMKWIVQAKDIPLSRLQFSGQVSGAETLKQQDAPLLAVCRQLQISLGDSWEDSFYMARRLVNAFAGAGLNEDSILQAQWVSPEVRGDDTERNILLWKSKREAGVPREQLWSEMGYSPEQIQMMQAMPEYAAMQALMTAGLAGG